MRFSKQLRLLVTVVALVLALAAAAPAMAEPAAWSGGWVTSGIDHLARWWTGLWEPSNSARAASEVTDPTVDEQAPQEPTDTSLVTSDESGSETEVWPNLDPDG